MHLFSKTLSAPYSNAFWWRWSRWNAKNSASDCKKFRRLCATVGPGLHHVTVQLLGYFQVYILSHFITDWIGVFIRITQLLKVLNPSLLQWGRRVLRETAVWEFCHFRLFPFPCNNSHSLTQITHCLFPFPRDSHYNKNLAIANRSRVSCINTNNNTMTLKSGLEVTQCHRKWCYSKA